MSRDIVFGSQFKRDAKKCFLDLISEQWAEVLHLLINDKELPPKYCDHPLKGNYQGFRDCHIKSDLVLIYKKQDNDLVLTRLGSHSDLFK